MLNLDPDNLDEDFAEFVAPGQRRPPHAVGVRLNQRHLLRFAGCRHCGEQRSVEIAG